MNILSTMAETKPIVILDANAFITGSGLLDLGSTHQLITTPDVLHELRDVKTRQMLEKFIFEIKQMEPTKKSIQFVRDFAKKTGDISSLSDVDVELLALAHTLYISRGLQSKIRKTPLPLKQCKPKQQQNEQQSDNEQQYDENEEIGQQSQQKQQQTVDQNKKQNKKEEGQEQSVKEVEQKQIKQKDSVNELPPVQLNDHKQTKQREENKQEEQEQQWIVVPTSKKNKRKQSDEDMGQDEGWITPKNFQKKMAEGAATFQNEDTQESQMMNSSCGISLMTADFAMQNVAIQMGVELKSLDGRQIKEVRRFTLECYLCWKQYKVDDNQVKLCKQCGYNSLSKLAYSLTPNGQMILHRKKGWKPSKKVLEWKQRKYEQQQKIKKNQRARRKKQPSIFDV